jgi:aspartate carbamoyltransferase catalytic subunit
LQQAFEHLLDIGSLEDSQLNALLDSAHRIKSDPEAFRNACEGYLSVNLFYEPSTRTRFSFEIAARKLGLQVVNFLAAASSVSKGETLIDSFKTIQAMRPDVIVFRHPDNGAAAEIAEYALPGTHVINAGDGSRAHPSQALLDMMTLQEHFDDLSQVSVLISGDLRHSRVTHSDVVAMRKLGVGEIRLAAPDNLQPGADTLEGTVQFDNLDDALKDVDVVMMLRIQTERLSNTEVPDLEGFHRDWGLTSRRLLLAKPDCLVMHPGPMNRGIEISSEVADGPQSIILEQVANGVFARMAILHAMCKSGSKKS